MELRGERVVLRPMTEADRPSLEAIVADPAVAEYWGSDTVELEPPGGEEPVHQWVVLVDGAVAGYVQAYEELEPQYTYAGMDIFLAPAFHGRGLGPEVLRQLPAGVLPDAVVGGVGTGGTIVGVGQAFRAVNPRCRVVAVEPNESCTLMCGEVGKHLIEGIADGFVPGIITRHRGDIDALVSVDSEQAIAEMRRLAKQFGLFVGPSSGAHLVAARTLKQEHDDIEHVVTFFCDEGEKYINDYFLT